MEKRALCAIHVSFLWFSFSLAVRYGDRAFVFSSPTRSVTFVFEPGADGSLSIGATLVVRENKRRNWVLKLLQNRTLAVRYGILKKASCIFH